MGHTINTGLLGVVSNECRTRCKKACLACKANAVREETKDECVSVSFSLLVRRGDLCATKDDVCVGAGDMARKQTSNKQSIVRVHVVNVSTHASSVFCLLLFVLPSVFLFA